MPSLPDILVLLVLPLGLVFIAGHFLTQRAPSSKPIPTFLIGLCMAMALVTFAAAFLPGEGYYLGIKGLLPTLTMWLLLPLLAWNILSGMASQSLGSPLAYIERRFDPWLAQIGAGVFVTGRIAVAAALLATFARMLTVATGNVVPSIWLGLAIGLIATAASVACGPRGTIWLQAWKVATIAVSTIFWIGSVAQAAGGSRQVWQIGDSLEKARIADGTFDLRGPESFWTLVPFTLAALTTYVLADESVYSAIRFARRPSRASAAFVTCLAIFTGLLCIWQYCGLALLAFYRVHPENIRPIWVANVDRETGLSLTDPATRRRFITDPRTGKPKTSWLNTEPQLDPTDGEALLPWNIDFSINTADELIRSGRLLHPNTGEPINDLNEVLDASGEHLDPARLATYQHLSGTHRSEMVLHRRATEEFWPAFIASRIAPGQRGVLLVGLIAIALSCVDLTAPTVAMTMGRWIGPATRTSNRVLTTMIGLAITLLAMLLTFLAPFPAELAVQIVASTLTPMAAVVCLGLTSRRANSATAIVALGSGILAATAFSAAMAIHGKAADAGIFSLNPMWCVTLSMIFTYIMGQMLAFFFGVPRTRDACRGLVLGEIPIGNLRTEVASTPLENS